MKTFSYAEVNQMAYDGVDCIMALHFESTDTVEKMTPAGILTAFGEMADSMVMSGEQDTILEAIEYLDKIAYICTWDDYLSEQSQAD